MWRSYNLSASKAIFRARQERKAAGCREARGGEAQGKTGRPIDRERGGGGIHPQPVIIDHKL